MSEAPPVRRIGIDLTQMQMGGVNGGAKPAAQMLVSLFAASDRFCITVFVRASYAEDLPFANHERVNIVRVDDRFPDSQDRMFGDREPWSLARASGCDLLFAPFGDPLLWERGLPTVTQQYDLQHLDHPEFFAREELRHREHSDRRLKDLSTHVVTSSTFSRDAFISKLGVEAERVSVIPLPLPVIPEEPDVEARIEALARLGLEDTTFLYYPANFWPHKNHLRLIEGFARATERMRDTTLHLVLTGDTLSAADEVRKCADDHGIANRVHVLGFVSDQERDAVWSACEALIFPSLYEGFGIPMQEAMLYQKPIAASNACSIPEVGGSAATYFDGHDVDAIASAIHLLVDDGDVQKTQEGAREAQLRLFDPVAIAGQYLELFERLISSAYAAVAPAELDIAIIECEDQLALATTIASLENQTVRPRTLTLVGDAYVDAAMASRVRDLARVIVVVDDTEARRAAGLDTALRASDGKGILLLRAGDVLLEDSLLLAGSAVATFPHAWLIYGLAVGVSSDSDDIWERPAEPVQRSIRSTRRFAERSSSVISRQTLEAAPSLDTARFAFEALVAQAPDDAESLHLPVFLTQTQIDRAGSAADLAALDGVLARYSMPDRGTWLIELCEAMVVAEGLQRGLGGEEFHVADRLLWAAPFMYALAEVPFDEASLLALKAKWRRARGGPEAALLMNPLQAMLASNPRDTVLRGLIGPPLQQRAKETFADPEVWRRTQSVTAFRGALENATADDLQAECQKLLSVGDTREFVVSAFEFAGKRTPCASEVALFAEADTADERLRALKDIISAATAHDWDDIVRAARERTPFHLASAPEIVYPLGSDKPTTANAWFELLTTARANATVTGNTDLEQSHPLPLTRHERGPSPSVTILCSLYNGDEYIQPYLENIVSQDDFDDFELVIIDACSPGNERQVIERFTAQHRNISYTRTDTRIGIYAAWNLAIQQSSGRYITNANLDDSRAVSSMARFRDALDAHPEIDVVYSDYYYTFIPHLAWNEIASVGLRTQFPPPTKHNMLDFNSPHCAPMWRRSLHERNGYFDETYRSAGDCEFWLRCIRSGLSMHKIDPPLVAYFHNPRGMSTQQNTPGEREMAAIRFLYRDLLIGENAPLDPLASVEDTYSRMTPDGA